MIIPAQRGDGLPTMKHSEQRPDHELNRPERSMTRLEEKIYVMADEVLDILKQLSQENKQQLNSKTLADRMCIRDSVKQIIGEDAPTGNDSSSSSSLLKDIADTVLDRFAELTPASISQQLSNSKENLNNELFLKDTSNWLDSTIKIIKKYYDSIAERNKELEEFMHQTIQQLEETEQHLSSELDSYKQKFSDDREFENTISSNMNMIKEDFHAGKDIVSIKKMVLSKIENINRGIEIKREQDLERLKETEQTLEAMGKKITDIKMDANELKKKAAELESESLMDNLTGLYNRKAYDQKIAESIANLRRYNISSSLLMCDVDDFKKINDSYGHNIGDLALKKLARLLKEKLRINDFISRYGGEEFTVILPNTDLSGAAKASESLLSFINKSVFSYKNNKIPLTISIGVSHLKKSDTADTVFDRADSALYLAKKSGKNAVRTENDILKQGSSLRDPVMKE